MTWEEEWLAGAAGPRAEEGEMKTILLRVWGSKTPARKSTGKLPLRSTSSGWGTEEGLRPALTAPSSLSRAVVEVTGHAHVLLAAFEKVSAALPLAVPVTRERG